MKVLEREIDRPHNPIQILHLEMGNASCTEGGYVRGDDEEAGWFFNALDYCDSETRSNCLFLTKRHCRILTSDVSFRWRLQHLHVEHGVYFSSEVKVLPKNMTWRAIYLQHLKSRHLWESGGRPMDEEGDGCSISVYARLKPRGVVDKENDVQTGRKVPLPLHQRLALIRISNGLKSNKDALSVLKEQGGWFKTKWDQLETSSPSTEDNASGARDDSPNLFTPGITNVDVPNSRVVVMYTKGLREFEFDGVMKDGIPQTDVYEASVRPLVCDVMNGINATLFAYGQTGSGKTFTMFGLQESQASSASSLVGIVPRACSEIMSATSYRKESLRLNMEASVSVSFVEVYGNAILDLLQGGRQCGRNTASGQRSVLDNNAEVPVEDVDGVMKLLVAGQAQRRKAATAMNSSSSRAHSVFIISLKQKCLETGKEIQSKLFLADLGGSEQTKKSKISAGKSSIVEGSETESGAVNSTGFTKSDRMREAVHINLGLMALKKCVEARRRGLSHVPYLESKLTMLLKPGLGGNSRTAVIVCAAQEEEHSSETINAFNFGQACRKVSNTVRTQDDMLSDLMKGIDCEITECEENIRQKEQWVVKEEKRLDPYTKEGFEIRKTTVLVGAEDDRKRLHNLLLRKSQLSGADPDEKLVNTDTTYSLFNQYA